MEKITAFLKRKNIVLSAKRYGIDAMGAMAQGLFASLLIGTILDALGKQPLITAGMRLGEGTGAVCAIPMLDMALSLYQDGTTFDSTGIEAYTPQGD